MPPLKLLPPCVLVCSFTLFGQVTATSENESFIYSNKLEVVKADSPKYPADALRNQRQGMVLVKLGISRSGVVQSAEAESGDPIFRKSALEAARNWKFQPVEQNGQAIAFVTEVPVEFFLRTPEPMNSAAANGPPPIPDFAELNGHRTVDPEAATKMRLRLVPPAYPRSAKENHITGKVLLRGMIRKDGLVGNLQVVSGPRELVQSAMDAASLWRFRPFMLRGEPVEVETTFQITYTLNGMH